MFKKFENALVRWGLHHVLRKGAAMTHIKIDRRAKTMELELELEDESSPIHIRVDQYTFEKPPEGPAQISVKESTSPGCGCSC